MAKKEAARIRAEATAVAKIEATAKASISRKKTITEVIPPDVSRSKAAAWLDLISPITQWAGLRGDKLRYKRDQLRIQQEASLDRVVREAMSELASLNARVAPLPNKFLVPFLERASLEDDESELGKRWSDLLVSAATEYSPSMVRFASVLSEIGAGEVALLRKMVVKYGAERGLNHIEDVPHIFVAPVLERMVDTHTKVSDDSEQLYKNIIKSFEYPGTAWPIVLIWESDGGLWDYESAWFTQKDEEMASTLVSVGVLHLLDGLEGRIGEREWSGRVYALTSFGLRFLLACDRHVSNQLKELLQRLESRERAAEVKDV
jgi:hypothetical protein